MSSIKCDNCGLVNFSDAENCKRCKLSLREPIGAWRDRRWLVKKIAAPLTERCIKCNESADVIYKPVSVKAYSAWSLLTQLAGVRIFRMIPVDVPLCRRHRSPLDWFPIVFMLVGIFIGTLGIPLMRMHNPILPISLFVSGFFVIMPFGILLYFGRREYVKVWRYKDPYVWLWGVDRSYLEGLPNWADRQAR